MTDNEIIKALECLAYWGECKHSSQCPYYMDNDIVSGCDNVTIAKEALDLINRQKAEIEENNLKIDHQAQIIRTLETALDNKMKEIERLKENNQKLYEEMAEREKEEVAIAKRMGKYEAIKEFAERLKEIAIEKGSVPIVFDDIDNLVKEMTEVEK